MNDNQLEIAFIYLFDRFLKLNLYIQKEYKSDMILKKQLNTIALVFEDLNEHYFWEEINRVKNEKSSGDRETH